MLQVVDGAQEAGDFFLAQHDGKLLCLTAGGDVVLDNPGPFEGGMVEKPERGDRDDDGTGCEGSFLGQVEEINPDLRGPEKVGRFAKWQANRTTCAARVATANSKSGQSSD